MDREKAAFEKLHKVEMELDQLVKDLYQNRLDKRAIIEELYSIQNPNLNGTPKKIKTEKKNIVKDSKNV